MQTEMAPLIKQSSEPKSPRKNQIISSQESEHSGSNSSGRKHTLYSRQDTREKEEHFEAVENPFEDVAIMKIKVKTQSRNFQARAQLQ